MTAIKGFGLHVKLDASQTRRRLKGLGFGVRKVESAGRGEAVIIHTATQQHLRELKRRDNSQPHKVVILPPGPNDLDLRPLSWLILKMRSLPDDGNTDTFAATLIGYLGLKEYEADLRKRLDSKHPAEAQAAAQALKMLDDAR